MSNVICNDLVMKTLPGDTTSNNRQRKCPQGSTSIYVPPPLRKRKNSGDKKNVATVPEKSKAIASRGIPLNLSSPSGKYASKSKKCENSYMLFGLEDMSNAPAKQEKTSLKLHVNDGKELNNFSASNIKKCDNSYLLFSSDLNDSKVETQVISTNKKLADKHTRIPVSSMKVESDSQKLSKNVDLSMVDSCTRNAQADSSVGVKPFESIVGPYLPEELSFELDSLSVGNKSPSFNAAKHSCKDILKSVKKSSLKKCDNSSFLFEDDSDDSSNINLPNFKVGKTYPRAVSNSVQGISSAQPFDDNLSTSSCLSTLVYFSNSPEAVTSDQVPTQFTSNDVRQDKLNTESKIKEVIEKSNKCSPRIQEEEVSEEHPSLPKTSDKLPETQSVGTSNADICDSIEDYVIEIYDFPKTLRTQDFMSIFSSYVQDGFFIKWVDDTHALGIFSNPFSVSDVLNKSFDLISIRPLQSATPASIDIAATLPVPSASRPRTCPSLARRLVSGALGLRVSVSDEIRQAEKKMLQEAKEERRLAAKQREDAWEGTLRSSLGT